MKKKILFITLFIATIVKAQIGINTTIPNAQLDIHSSNQANPSNTDGILIPKVDAFPIANPTAAQQGMMVYLTVTSGVNLPGFYYWDNTTTNWISIGAKHNWGLNGNLGTNATTDFIGTKDNQSLVIRTNNTEHIKIDNTGKIGIGGVNPSYPFEFKSITGDKICLYNTGPLKSYGFGINNSLLQVFSSNIGSSIGFGYGSSTSFTENVRFTGGGNVGIGTSNPLSKLHLKTNATGMTPNPFASATIEDNQYTFLNLLSNQESGVVFGSNGVATSGGIIYSPASMPNSLQFRTDNNSTRMTISETGNVGIGSFKSDYPLQFETVLGDKISLYGGLGTHYGFGIQSALLQIHSASSTDDIAIGYGISAAFTENVRFKGSGFVGIGTPNPASKLQINASNQVTPSNTDGIIIPKVDAFSANNPTAAQNGMLVFLTNTVGLNKSGFYYWDHLSTSWLAVGNKNQWSLKGNAGTNPATDFIGTTDNTDLSFKTNNSEAIRVTTTGNVGIRTSTPTAELEINGFTKMGSAAPALKVLKLTGTTGATQGNTTFIAHGINSAKIVAVNVLVDYSAGSSVPPSYNGSIGYEYDYYITGTHIVIWTKSGNSGFILSKPIRILVTYEQ